MSRSPPAARTSRRSPSTGSASTGGWGEHVAHVEAHETLAAGRGMPELAILATKAQDAAAALRANREVLGAVPLLVAQNGLGGLEVARSVLPESPLLGGLALFAASYLEPGRVTVTAALPLIVGAGAGTSARTADRIVEVLRGALPIEVTDDILGAQWTKLLINHVNALPAITGLSVQQVIADPGLRKVMTASMRETVRVARRLGIRFGRVQGVSGRVLGAIGSAPLALGAWLPRTLAARMGSVPNPGSTLQSIRRGQLTEIDFLNGAVVSAAKSRRHPRADQCADRRAGARGRAHRVVPLPRRGRRAGSGRAHLPRAGRHRRDARTVERGRDRTRRLREPVSSCRRTRRGWRSRCCR